MNTPNKEAEEAAFPSWDDLQPDHAMIWAALWSCRNGGPDVRTLNDYLQTNFENWLCGRDGGWMLLGLFPSRESASHFLVALDKFEPGKGPQ